MYDSSICVKVLYDACLGWFMIQFHGSIEQIGLLLQLVSTSGASGRFSVLKLVIKRSKAPGSSNWIAQERSVRPVVVEIFWYARKVHFSSSGSSKATHDWFNSCSPFSILYISCCSSTSTWRPSSLLIVKNHATDFGLRNSRMYLRCHHRLIQ